MSKEVALTETPFDKRHLCWFCEEPAGGLFTFVGSLPQAVAIPACRECRLIANARELDSLYEYRLNVKDTLLKRYAKHLAIGSNWTREELEDSGFDCKILGGFKKSAWFMYEVARDRINARGWTLTVNGVPVEDTTADTGFEHSGLRFASLSAAAHHFSQTQGLDEAFLCALVKTLGRSRFGYALRLATLYRVASAKEKQQFLSESREDEALR
ncbi:hypothetical protein [Shewanella litorisediminis]|uniref:Uncharacterized protein n=1 Tax=Shewanella litorisediminis TaxID=1173586 RepID=A0ABX7FZ45_9GAMM|nr:hypothetical protein [Shewanella litorisediminis]MCL2918711.1 hypothetical protein [Shewanella litorisediminis]QRH00316.1 hypothetical protein JQC75_10385 [Shewanella litorisediminis]